MENKVRLGPEPSAEADPVDLSPAMRRVLEVLRGAGRALRVGEVADIIGSHDNTVRGHLKELLARRVVTTSAAPAVGRGRPAVLYSARPRPAKRVQEYRALTGAFAADLVNEAGRADVGERARRVGRSWGERLGATPGGIGVEALEESLSDLGFGPERDAHGWRLTTCPLLDLAQENAEVICQVHLGLVDGIVGPREGGDTPVLTPFAEPGACLLRVPDL